MISQYTQSILVWVLAALTAIAVPVILWLLPPPMFSSAIVEIPHGATINEAAEQLAEAEVVYISPLVSLPLRLQNKTITAGTYKFDEPLNALAVSERIATGDFGIPQQQVVIPEGFNNEQIANRLADSLSEENFSRTTFLTKAKPLEGYLFPDSYRFFADAKTEEVIERMRENFNIHIQELAPEIYEFEHSFAEVIKMASLVEEEAADYEIRRRIAGVLWRRFELDMPLQVDAIFPYLIGKSTYEVTTEDLQIDSPYNLYQNTGLPPTAISNPGLESIRATINPIESEALYYLNDDDGNFYFAENLSEHNENKRRFLNTTGG